MSGRAAKRVRRCQSVEPKPLIALSLTCVITSLSKIRRSFPTRAFNIQPIYRSPVHVIAADRGCTHKLIYTCSFHMSATLTEQLHVRVHMHVLAHAHSEPPSAGSCARPAGRPALAASAFYACPPCRAYLLGQSLLIPVPSAACHVAAPLNPLTSPAPADSPQAPAPRPALRASVRASRKSEQRNQG